MPFGELINPQKPPDKPLEVFGLSVSYAICFLVILLILKTFCVRLFVFVCTVLFLYIFTFVFY